MAIWLISVCLIVDFGILNVVLNLLKNLVCIIPFAPTVIIGVDAYSDYSFGFYELKFDIFDVLIVLNCGGNGLCKMWILQIGLYDVGMVLCELHVKKINFKCMIYLDIV